MGFPPLFIHHVFWFSVLAVTIDLRQGNLIRRLERPRPIKSVLLHGRLEIGTERVPPS